MFTSQRTKQIGIVLSYSWLILATYLFNWKPFSVFIGFLMEMLVILLLYSFFRIKAQINQPAAFRKVGDLSSIFFGASVFLFFSYKMIEGFSWRLEPDSQDFSFYSLISSKEVLISFAAMFLIYFGRVINLESDLFRELILRQNMMIKILAMSLTTLIPFLLIFEYEFLNFLYILPFVFLGRIVVELYFKDSTEE